MGTTIESSADDVEPVLQTIPEPVRNWIYARDDELQRRRGSDLARAELVRDIRTQAVQEREALIEAATRQAIEQHWPAFQRTNQHLRTGFILERLLAAPGKYGLPAGYKRQLPGDPANKDRMRAKDAQIIRRICVENS